ncbi:MAG: DegT/DnrJ/EryC1/StrS family aminotransferase [Spirochaetes bacterium]|nr:MAG: DegT/DnrJ/EryC1/StrS family aminotransferase [Spirochaetota bacterium]
MPGPGAFLFGEEEKKHVLEVLESGYLSRYGKDEDKNFKQKVYTLESEFAKKIGVQHCVAVNSGTSALIASLKALDIGAGDEVLVPGYTFIASISSIISAGATPVLTEIDESLTVDPDDLENKITGKTKVVMPVHMLGNPCDMDEIMKIARKHNLFVIEDCCQAVGGGYKGERLGSIGDMGGFSFNIYKVINAGDGGMITTNNRQLYERAFAYHDQGHKPLRKGVEIGERTIVGVNMRMNELTGAFLLGQLSKLDTILDLLREKKKIFKELLSSGDIKDMSFRKINDPEECATLLTIQFPEAGIAEKVAKALRTKTLSGSGWHVYNNMEQILQWRDSSGKRPFSKNMLPKTDDILSRSINLSVGVVDPGIGADFGINILTDNKEIEKKAEEFIRLVKGVL